MPIIEYTADIEGSYASLQPQPSRASLRKKRIRKDVRGYVDLLFTVDIDKGAYAQTVDLQFISDGYYPITCNFLISIWDPQLQTQYAEFVVTYPYLWRIGEKVYVGDSSVLSVEVDEEDYIEGVTDLSSRLSFAEAFNEIFISNNYSPGAQFIVRITFDREDFYTWDRGFFLRPVDVSPKLIFDVAAFAIDTRDIFVNVETVFPPPTYRDIHIFSSVAYITQRDFYVLSQAYDTRDIFVPVYKEFIVTRELYMRSTSVYVPPPDPGSVIGPDPTERTLYWEFLSGDLETERSMFFPISAALEDNWYINGDRGSDDYTLQESKIKYTPFRSIDWFFEAGGGEAANDLDVISLTGTFIDQLIFNLEFFAESASTPVRVIQSEDTENEVIIEGHIACETTCITNLKFENLTFRPSTAINKTLSGTTQHMLYLTFCDPAEHVSLDPYYSISFKECKFLVQTTFENAIASLIYLNLSNTGRTQIFITFDQCLIGVDGPGSLDQFLYVLDMYNVNVLFKNCSFLNPFGKTSSNNQKYPLVFDYKNTDQNIKMLFANCIFWNFLYDTNISLADQPEFFRCYEGDPILLSNIIGNANFGKLSEDSPCYRQWLPGYGQNIGWDQTLPYALITWSTNIFTLKTASLNYSTDIIALLDIKDKYFLEIGAAFGRTPIIADTFISTKFSERTIKWVTQIPNIKTLIGRLNTFIDVSFTVSIDLLATELLLHKYPKWYTEMPNVKEMYTDVLVSDIRTGKDTEPPYIARYGIPEWYEPIFGDKVYYYFEVFDLGTGVDISSLIIDIEGTEYRYGSPEIRIEPLKANRQAYRIMFLPPNSVVPDQVLELEISIRDCVQNKGPVWDKRTFGTVIHYEELTLEQKTQAMIPCFFTLYWGDKIFTDSFEGIFAPYIYIRDWLFLFSDDFETEDLRTKFVDSIYDDDFEYWSPYIYIRDWVYLYSDLLDPLLTVAWNGIYVDDIDNMTVPGSPSQWNIIYYEVDPSLSVVWTVLFAADTYEYRPTIIWQSLYQDEDPVLPPYIGLFFDGFEYETVVTWGLLYSEPEPGFIITWKSLFNDDLEWWDAYRNIVYADVYDPYFDKFTDYVLTVTWGKIYIDTEEEPQYAGRIFIDKLEWWAPYHTIGWSLLYEDDLAGPSILWNRIFLDDTDLVAVWSYLYSDDFDYLGDITFASLFHDEFEWRPTVIWVEFHEDDLEYEHAPLISTSIYSDGLEWATINGFNNRYYKFYIDGLESEFLPYRTIIWNEITIFSEYYPLLSTVFKTDTYFSDEFEFAVFVFKTAYLYREGFEYLGILEYALQQTYRFELVQWEEFSLYEEDFEYLDEFNYFDPFDEDFEWAPVVSYVEPAQATETFELDKVWVLLFIDDLESW